MTILSFFLTLLFKMRHVIFSLNEYVCMYVCMSHFENVYRRPTVSKQKSKSGVRIQKDYVTNSYAVVGDGTGVHGRVEVARTPVTSTVHQSNSLPRRTVSTRHTCSRRASRSVHYSFYRATLCYRGICYGHVFVSASVFVSVCLSQVGVLY